MLSYASSPSEGHKMAILP
ncbi:hypothetical protein A2U01_0107911, partial [Trifolium medium]|nr:hypothetical protein [Trifolium medium]